MELREYQKKAVSQVYKALSAGERRIVLSSCTGSGKTVVMSKIAADALGKGRKVLIVVDDSPLIPQTIDKLSKFNIVPGLIKAGYRENRNLPCQLASIDTLIRRRYPPADLILIDECHLSFSRKYTKLFESYPAAAFIGFSATPERTKAKENLFDIWKCLVRSLTISEAVELGANVPPRIFSVAKGTLDLSKIKSKEGDYEEGMLGTLMSSPTFLHRAVQEWKDRGENRPTIAFAVNVAHSQALKEKFLSQGISAEHIDGTTPELERLAMYTRLRNGETKVLCSVNVLSIGFDEPCVSCILCCRPTKSRILWIQMVGRGLRLFEGKNYCLVLDQAENVHSPKLGHPLEYTPPDLDKPAKESGESPSKECPGCGNSLPSFTKVCPFCGHVFTKELRAEIKQAEFVYVPSEHELKKLKQRDYYRAQIKKAIRNNYNPDFASVRFKENFGSFPRSDHRLGAIFDGKNDRQTILLYYNYLTKSASRAGKEDAWIEKHLRFEFGNI